MDINTRLDAIESKMDLILQRLDDQHKNASIITDLADDVSNISKEIYKSAVIELDQRKIEINTDEINDLLFTIVRNIGNFKTVVNLMEAMLDLFNDAGPIINENIINFTNQLSSYERKGYFEFIKNIIPILDNVVQGLKPEDLKGLADNIMLIIYTIKDITQPDMLKSIDNAVKIYSSIETENIPSVSMWKALRELNSPEMKKALGFALTFLKNISKNTN